jgi:hypothetical protein
MVIFKYQQPPDGVSGTEAGVHPLKEVDNLSRHVENLQRPRSSSMAGKDPRSKGAGRGWVHDSPPAFATIEAVVVPLTIHLGGAANGPGKRC